MNRGSSLGSSALGNALTVASRVANTVTGYIEGDLLETCLLRNRQNSLLNDDRGMKVIYEWAHHHLGTNDRSLRSIQPSRSSERWCGFAEDRPHTLPLGAGRRSPPPPIGDATEVTCLVLAWSSYLKRVSSAILTLRHPNKSNSIAKCIPLTGRCFLGMNPEASY